MSKAERRVGSSILDVIETKVVDLGTIETQEAPEYDQELRTQEIEAAIKGEITEAQRQANEYWAQLIALKEAELATQISERVEIDEEPTQETNVVDDLFAFFAD